MRSIPFHPFLLAAFPILALYSHNKGQLTPTELILPSAIALGAVLGITALLWLILKDIKKSAILASVSATLFLSAGHIDNFLVWALPWLDSPSSFSWILTLFVSLSLAVGLSVLVVLPGTRSNMGNLTVLLNVVGLVLVMMPAVSILRYEAFGRTVTSSLSQTEWGEAGLAPEQSSDIYYIILDAYASSATLQEFYGYDNSPFTDYLEEKGFYVALESRANYNTTSLSLPSSLNMQYVNNIIESGEVDSRMSRSMIRNNEVMQLLKTKGYKYVHFSSGMPGTDSNENADFNYRPSWAPNEFSTILVRQTMAYPFLHGRLQEADRDRILFTFSEMADLREIEGPKFVFAHIICPHPPYIFGPNGEPVPGADLAMEGSVWSLKDLYLDQLSFVNSMTMTLIDSILSKSKVPPIIILQADHGPASLGPASSGDFQATDEFLRERFGILNAYYLPGGGDSLLYQTITPVNSFRVLFDFYFGTDIGLLEDKNYYLGYWGTGEFFDATARLNIM